jgi:hypothetical protein
VTGVLTTIGDGFKDAFLMAWEVWWALVLGFAISAIVQAWVPRERIQQQATYDQAMSMSREKGPCCCHCWRWTAFRGMSKYLIVHASWSAPQVALLIDDVQGCGGKDAPPGVPAQAAT